MPSFFVSQLQHANQKTLESYQHQLDSLKKLFEKGTSQILTALELDKSVHCEETQSGVIQQLECLQISTPLAHAARRLEGPLPVDAEESSR